MTDSILLEADKTLYTARTRTTGGREGQAHSDDGRLDVRLDPPGTQGRGTNPEQLFAAGWSACFESAMTIAARRRRFVLPSGTSIDAEIDLRNGRSGYSLAARLAVSVPGLARDIAQAIINEAHETCPYSKAIRGNVAVEVRLM